MEFFYLLLNNMGKIIFNFQNFLSLKPINEFRRGKYTFCKEAGLRNNGLPRHPSLLNVNLAGPKCFVTQHRQRLESDFSLQFLLAFLEQLPVNFGCGAVKIFSSADESFHGIYVAASPS